MHDQNIFLTLTYDNDHLPADMSLHKSHLQKFFKRLRKHYADKRIRYFAVGEYGDRTNRPHYHAIVFGLRPDDRKQLSGTEKNKLYESAEINRIWGHGFAPFGSVTFDSAGYCARYAIKKITGDKSEAHYQGRTPEYATMSRRPGIGRPWYDKYASDVYPADEIVINGRKVKPPKAYDRYLEEASKEIEEIKEERREKGKENESENTCERLAIRKFIKEEQLKLNRRKI